MQKTLLFSAFALIALAGLAAASSGDDSTTNPPKNTVRLQNVPTNGMTKDYKTHEIQFTSGFVSWSLTLSPVAHRQASQMRRSFFNKSEEKTDSEMERTSFVLNATCTPSCEFDGARLTRLFVPKTVRNQGYFSPTENYELPKTLFTPKQKYSSSPSQEEAEVLACDGCTMDLEIDFHHVYEVDFAKVMSQRRRSHQQVFVQVD